MQHKLMQLPYESNALEPVISKETIEYHYGKHHQKYVDTLNDLIKNSEFESMPLLDVIKQSSGATFNNAAQVFNHDFYWSGLTPEKTSCSPALHAQVEKDFGSMQRLKEEFTANAAKNFGSGWTWLVFKNGKLQIINTSNADTPVKDGVSVLLTCDVWEHAYYIDYRNARPSYLEKWWDIVNWDFVSQNFANC
jgi:Fe-Mn family superoxide dismutase